MIDDSLIGRQLANFRIERSLGRGGMAQVYYGQDVKLQRPVAIKVIDVRYRGNPAYAERFVREAQAVATWRHEHIVQIYYADDEDGLYYFVMEYIDGLDLGQLIVQYRDKAELLPHHEALRIGRAFASALDYAHKQGVVHRDVKPSNLMVARDGRVVLTDFGLAMDVEQGSMGEVFGSAQYIAPEQARRSANAVPQSDLYSLGVILYELLTGRVPFDDPSPTAVAIQHMTLDPPAPRELNPELNEATETVLLKALRKAPEERYQTGKEMVDALEQALQAAEQPAGTASAPPNLLGQQLDEYRLEALEGQGGMARVYRGVDVRLNRRVAIKVIDTPFRTDSDYVMRFQREAQAIAQLEHPHIVRLYRYGEALGVLYIAMQHIEGKNLHSLIAKHRQERTFIPAEEVSRIIRQVGQALDYAHSQGVIHRDVKPSNIMLNKEGTVFLTDFGLALLTEVGTRGEILGSPHYIAPEQAMSSANVTPQSDLYAVGVILYEMLTGELPFEAGEPLEIAMLHMTESPPAPRELRPGLSRPVEAVLLKALAKKPEDRYPSGVTLADALDEALRSAPISDVAAGASLPVRTEAAKAANLPPIPAAVAPQPSKPRPEPPSITSVISGDSSAAAAARPSTRQRAKKRQLSLVVAAVVVVVLLLAAAAFWLLRGWGTAEPAQVDQPAATATEVAAVVERQPVPETPTAVSTDTPAPEPTLAAGFESPTKTAIATATGPVAPETPTVTKASLGDNLASPPPAANTPTLTVGPTATPVGLSLITPTSTLTTTLTPTPTPVYRLAFTKWDGGKHTVWIADTNGENQKPLLGFAASPSWSPDGTNIAFLGEQGIDSLVGSGSGGVWRMTDQGWAKQLKEDGGARSVAWMPTGNSIAFDAAHGGPDFRVYFVDSFGAEQVGAIPGEHPAWSPDGTELVIRACRPNCGLWVVDRNDSRARQLTFDTSDGLPAWSPDGEKIAFSRGTPTDIFVIGAAGSAQPEQLTEASGHDFLPAWTPDSERIVFRSARNGRWQIFIMNADGSDQQMIIDQAPVSDSWPMDRMSVTK